MRIARALAMIGIASRRDAERLVIAGRVRVDGQLVRDPAFSIYPDQVQLSLDGKVVEKLQEYRYVALNKPVGVVSTVRDPHATRTVMDLVERDARLYPVGRLDKDSEGLILLTNDGSFANIVTHPRYGVEKEYRALVRQRPTREALERLQRGVMLDGESARAIQADMERQSRDGTWVRLVLKEGRKREVRRMLEAVGHPVLRLVRTRVGPIRLGNLAPGAHRELSDWEVRRLVASARPERRPRAVRREAEAAAEAAMAGEGAFATQEHAGSAAAAGPFAKSVDRRDPPLLIAIDGPAGAGKSTVGAALAERLRATLVDTGIFYRVVTLLALERGVDFADAGALVDIARELDLKLGDPRSDLTAAEVLVGDRPLGAELRTPEVDAHVSTVAGSPEVREALIEPQRRAVAGGRAVVVGRDIGTVICPDADVKIYLEATPDERARRRALQLGEEDQEAVRAAVERRDELDRTRSVAPLEVAPDAIVVKTDGIPVHEVVKRIYRMARDREAARG
jgi:23S rRNA pseudouridine2605 synthase